MSLQEDSNKGHLEVILNNSNEEIKLKNEVFFWSATEMTLHENVKKRIEKMCLSAQSSKLKVEDSSIKHNLMVDLAHKLVYCRHGKVRSLWSKMLAIFITSFLGGNNYIYGAFF